jgi:hypothetical protein
MQQSVTFSPDEYIAGPISGQPSCIEDERQLANQMVPFGDDFGVVNIINCHNLTLRQIRVKNTKTFLGTTLRTQSSCAVNIGDSSEIILDGCTFEGNGKSVVLVHNCVEANGNPGVKLTNCTVSGHYFEFTLGASDVTVESTMVFQDHGSPDSHSAVSTTAAYGTQPLKLQCKDSQGNVTHEYIVASSGLANGKSASRNPQVKFDDVTFEMVTGRPVVSGNTSDFTKVSSVVLEDAKINIASGHRGLLRWHGGASNSINLSVAGTTKMWRGTAFVDIQTNDWMNYLTTIDPSVSAPSGLAAMGRFVNYDDPPELYPQNTTTKSDNFSAYSVTNPNVKQ